MIFISHRGNLNGLNPARENSPSYIREAISAGFDVEIDIHWWRDGIWLGHDEPEWGVPMSFLEEIKDHIWIHCKNFAALTNLIDRGFRVFYHEKEQYTIINNGLIWAHNIDFVDDKCIIPLLSRESVLEYDQKNVYGICSDFVYECRDKFGHK